MQKGKWEKHSNNPHLEKSDKFCNVDLYNRFVCHSQMQRKGIEFFFRYMYFE